MTPVSDEPPRAETVSRTAWPTRVRRFVDHLSVTQRIGLAALAVFVFAFGHFIMLPTIDPAFFKPLFGLKTGDALTLRSWDYGIFRLGLMPYMHGSVLALILSGMFRGIRRWRDGSAPDTRRFDVLVMAMTVFLAALYALSVMRSPETISADRDFTAGLSPMTTGGGTRSVARTFVRVSDLYPTQRVGLFLPVFGKTDLYRAGLH